MRCASFAQKSSGFEVAATEVAPQSTDLTAQTGQLLVEHGRVGGSWRFVPHLVGPYGHGLTFAAVGPGSPTAVLDERHERERQPQQDQMHWPFLRPPA